MNHVINFQKDNGLVPDGVIGPKTCAVMKKEWELTTTELSHFLGQCHVETGGFTLSKENLNYSAEGLLKVFPKYFTRQEAQHFQRQPVKIANKVYANRGGNGDYSSGDGWKYRGRGAIQTTLNDNYAALAKFLCDDWVMVEPDIVADKYFWDSGLFYFERNDLWRFCNKVSTDTITKVSMAVNLGNPYSNKTPNHLEDRIKWTNYYFKIMTS